MFYFFYDYWYFILVVPALLFGLFAQSRVSMTFRRFSQHFSARGQTAAEVTAAILRQNGIYDVSVEHVSGSLTDHFDPKRRCIRLSDSVYGSTSIAAIGVAAHETGHAMQYAEQYGPIRLRAAIIPITNFSSRLAPFVILLGLLFYLPLVPIGIVLFSAVALFQLITLPVEYNASRRALQTLAGLHLLSSNELIGAKKVLSAAALTYVAALVTSLASLLRLILLYQSRERR